MKLFFYAILLVLAVTGITYLVLSSESLREEYFDQSHHSSDKVSFAARGKTRAEYIAYLKRTIKPGEELSRRIRAIEDLPSWP